MFISPDSMCCGSRMLTHGGIICCAVMVGQAKLFVVINYSPICTSYMDWSVQFTLCISVYCCKDSKIPVPWLCCTLHDYKIACMHVHCTLEEGLFMSKRVNKIFHLGQELEQTSDNSHLLCSINLVDAAEA